MDIRSYKNHCAFLSRISIACALVASASGLASAQARGPSINFGHAVEMRMENAAENDAGVTKLVLDVLLDSTTNGPFVMTLEQSHRVLATATCEASTVVYSGVAQTGQMYLDECATPYIPSANIRTNEPVDVAIALVNDATDARTELYRGTFPVIGFYDWTGNGNNGPKHVEQRQIRMDSMYGAGYVHQYLADYIEFFYATTVNNRERPNEGALRCKVGAGEWRVYETSTGGDSEAVIRNRAYVNDEVHEDGQETIITQIVHSSARMPIAVVGGTARPSAGSSMDGSWTCELRFGGAGTRVVAREFRFEVRNGYIQSHALESQIRAGRGSAFVSIGIPAEAAPVIFDPALVRGTLLGIRLNNNATTPLVSAMPARATNPALTAPAAPGRSGGGGGRRR